MTGPRGSEMNPQPRADSGCFPHMDVEGTTGRGTVQQGTAGRLAWVGRATLLCGDPLTHVLSASELVGSFCVSMSALLG